MKRTDIAAGMEVYYVDHGYQWMEAIENIEESRATVIEIDHFSRTGFGRVVRDPRGTLVHIKQLSDGYDLYVAPGRLRGEYEKIAKVRRELQGETKARQRSAHLQRAERERILLAVKKEAHALGFTSVSTGFRDRDAQFLELTAAELHALLTEAREYRRLFAQTIAGGGDHDGSMG